MTKVYIIQEWFDDVFCEKLHESPYKKDKKGRPKRYRCDKRINCSRRIYEITRSREYAIEITRNKPTWGYEEYDLDSRNCYIRLFTIPS